MAGECRGGRRRDRSSGFSDADTLEIFYAHSSIHPLSAWVSTQLQRIALVVVSALAAALVIPVLARWATITLPARRAAAPHGRAVAVRGRIGELSEAVADDLGAVREIVDYRPQSARTRQMLRSDGVISAEQRCNVRLAALETAAPSATRQGRTTVTVARRLSTLLCPDRILVLDDDQLAGDDNHDDLLASCEAHRHLVAPQPAAVQ